MPRVNRGGAASQQGTAQAKLKRCLQALVTNPEAACLGGNDLCCVGCGGNSDLVDSLCAFCLHSDAARRFFASNGGLDALLVAGKSRQEKTVLAALQLLSCLGTTQLGQQMILKQKPELLQLLVVQASDSNEDKEGVQHAALMILTDWAMDAQQDSQLALWFAETAMVPAVQSASSTGFSAATAGATAQGSQPMVFGASDMMDEGNDMESQHTQQAQHQGGGSSESALLSIALRCLQHPTLALRKAAAQLFVAAAAAPSGKALNQHDNMAAAATQLRILVQQVNQILTEEQQAATLPRFTALSNGRSQLMLDPLTFLRHQEQLQQHKLTCHALLHITCALAVTGPGAHNMLQEAGVLPCILRVFESAWQVHRAAQASKGAQPGGTGNTAGLFTLGASAMTSASNDPAAAIHSTEAPFSFIQDVQSRELALETLLVVFKQPGMLIRLGQQLQQQNQMEDQQQQQQQMEDQQQQHMHQQQQNQMEDQQQQQQQQQQSLDQQQCEEQALQRLHLLVQQLVMQHSAGHVRAALTLLGHVRFDLLPRGWITAADHSSILGAMEGLSTGGHDDDDAKVSSQTDNTTSKDARQAWLQLLCTIFEVAWRGEGLTSGAAQQQPTANVQGDSGGGDGGEGGVEDERTTGPGRMQTSDAGQSNIDQEMASTSKLLPDGLGLGFRVLVQVLQAWKSLQEAGAPAVLAVLESTPYKQDAQSALTHPKYLVASAAYRVVYHGTVYEQALLAQRHQHYLPHGEPPAGVGGGGDPASLAVWQTWSDMDGMAAGLASPDFMKEFQAMSMVQQDAAVLNASPDSAKTQQAQSQQQQHNAAMQSMGDANQHLAPGAGTLQAGMQIPMQQNPMQQPPMHQTPMQQVAPEPASALQAGAAAVVSSFSNAAAGGMACGLQGALGQPQSGQVLGKHGLETSAPQQQEAAADNDTFQEFLSVLLEPTSGDAPMQEGADANDNTQQPLNTGAVDSMQGQVAPSGQAATSILPVYMGAGNIPADTQGLNTNHNNGNSINSNSGANAQQGMFASWATTGDTDEAEVLAEALALLPDLDAIARNTVSADVGVRPGRDAVPWGVGMPMRPGAPIMSPLSMFNL